MEKETVYDHFRELRFRFFVCALVLIVAGTILYFFYEPILKILSSTLGSQLYYSTPSGGFSFIMRICFSGALIFTVPVIIYNVIMFVRPAIEKTMTFKKIILITLASTILAIAGAAFAFFCILPETISFFKSFQVSGLSALIAADNYLTFVTSMIAVFAIVFQVPLIMIFIDSINQIPPKKMLKMEKWVVVISLVVAIIAPFNYDVISTVLVATPIVALYNLSIIIIVFRQKLIGRKNLDKNYSILVKKTSAITNTEILLDNSVLNNWKNELADLKKINPAVKSSKSMEFKSRGTRPEDVKPASWKEEKKKQILEINTGVQVFSDFNQAPSQPSRALASQ